MSDLNKVLIFGIGGFVGGYLAMEFLNYGYSVVGSDILSNNNTIEEIEYYKTDLMKADDVTALVKNVKPDIIVNLAAISSVGASWNIPQTTMSVNVIGALNIMEAARKCDRLPKLMFIGSSEEYEISNQAIDETMPLNANNPYGISKMAQEKFVNIYKERYGMKIYYVRPFNHTGVGQKDSFVLASFCKQVAQIEKTGEPGIIKVGNLSAERDFSDVRDVVRAYRMIVESDNCNIVYNVGSGKAYKLEELLDYIISLSSLDIKIEIDKARYRPADVPTIYCDNRRIKSVLSWEPEYSIFNTLKEMYDDYLNN